MVDGTEPVVPALLDTDWVTELPPLEPPTMVSTTRVSYTRRTTTMGWPGATAPPRIPDASTARITRNTASVSIVTVTPSGPPRRDTLRSVVATAAMPIATVVVSRVAGAARPSHCPGG